MVDVVADFSYPDDEYLLLGKVVKAHGLRGEVKIFLFSGQPENLKGYREIVLAGKNGRLSAPHVILRSRAQGKAAVVQLASIANRVQAEQIEGDAVLLARKHLPAVGDNEYYWHNYQDKLVVGLEGNTIGRVTHIFTNGAQDVLVVKTAGEELLIPITKGILVGETAEKLIVDLPPGLMELNSNSAG
ncbi:MAG: ribosome maturation factor RimM [Desulforhopalus sp.]|nr:ribosome maturation factor RimM [Desulforhopalus sp.]